MLGKNITNNMTTISQTSFVFMCLTNEKSGTERKGRGGDLAREKEETKILLLGGNECFCQRIPPSQYILLCKPYHALRMG